MKNIKITSKIVNETAKNYYLRSEDYKKVESKIQKELDAVQHMSRVRTIDAYHVIYAIRDIEKRYYWTTKKQMEGCEIVFDNNAQQFCKAYSKAAKGSTPQSTKVELKHDGKCWNVVDIYRGDCDNKGYKFNFTHMTDEFKNALIEMERIF